MKQETTTITNNELTPEQATQQDLLRWAIDGMTEAAHMITTLGNEVKAGRHESIGLLPKAYADFRKAGDSALDERRKLDRLLGKLVVGEGGVELDLDAARAEIRCRMDRLRTAGGAGGVSE
jgi:hypothetical protein